MAKPDVFKLDLGGVSEPDDLWDKMFFIWVKNLEELNALTFQRLNALENAVTELDKAVAQALPDQPESLRSAMQEIQDLRQVWEEQSSRSLQNVERIAVTVKQIVASQGD